MRRLLPLAAVPVLIALAACSGGSPGTISTPPSAAVPAATSAAPALGPLTLGAFPSTTAGRAAKGLCEAWQGLRTQYAANVSNDSPVQLNQWFSGPDWATARSDADKLGSTATYATLEAAFGVATVGDTASPDTARNLDKACAAG